MLLSSTVNRTVNRMDLKTQSLCVRLCVRTSSWKDSQNGLRGTALSERASPPDDIGRCPTHGVLCSALSLQQREAFSQPQLLDLILMAECSHHDSLSWTVRCWRVKEQAKVAQSRQLPRVLVISFEQVDAGFCLSDQPASYQMLGAEAWNQQPCPPPLILARPSMHLVMR